MSDVPSDADDLLADAPEAGLDLAMELAPDAPAEQQPDQAGWLCDALDIPPHEWTTIASVVRPLPAFDVQSALVALERLPEQFSRAAFEQGFPTSIRSVEVRVDESTTETAALVGTHVAFWVDGVGAVVWIESEMSQPANELRLVSAAESLETASTALDQVADAIVEHSTWRKRPVLFDPTPDGVLRALPPGPVHEPPAVVAEEITRSIIDPLRTSPDGPSERILLTGPPGSGKTSVADWLADSLRGQATVTYVPPRVVSSPDLVHLSFEVAAADTPSVLVFDHIDLILGDRYSMRYPESLAEMITKLTAPEGRGQVAVLGLATSSEALDPVLLQRFGRRIELGAAPPAEVDDRLQALVDKYAAGDRVVLEALRSRSRGWVIGQVAELEQLVELHAAGDGPIDLSHVAGRVGTPVVAGETGGEGGNYL